MQTSLQAFMAKSSTGANSSSKNSKSISSELKNLLAVSKKRTAEQAGISISSKEGSKILKKGAKQTPGKDNSEVPAKKPEKDPEIQEESKEVQKKE